MQTLSVTLAPLTAFGTKPLGDTLFGQLCWLLREHHSEAQLTQWLDGYLANQPFLAVSDAMPKGYIPRPHVPLSFFEPATGADEDRKKIKKMQWLPLATLDQPFATWLDACQTEQAIVKLWQSGLPDEDKTPHSAILHNALQPHNSLNRLTDTTGLNHFAPYSVEQWWYPPCTQLEVHLCFDESRIDASRLHEAFTYMGQVGFGRDANVGLGKFTLVANQLNTLPATAQANAYLTLAPCAPQGLALQADHSFYQPFTRFGRHGSYAALSGKPFKSPILMAQTGAVLTPVLMPNAPDTQRFIGQGLGGTKQLLSKSLAATVHQGYAPVIPILFAPRLESS